jgi:hypothetical protein
LLKGKFLPKSLYDYPCIRFSPSISRNILFGVALNL